MTGHRRSPPERGPGNSSQERSLLQYCIDAKLNLSLSLSLSLSGSLSLAGAESRSATPVTEARRVCLECLFSSLREARRVCLECLFLRHRGSAPSGPGASFGQRPSHGAPTPCQKFDLGVVSIPLYCRFYYGSLH